MAPAARGQLEAKVLTHRSPAPEETREDSGSARNSAGGPPQSAGMIQLPVVGWRPDLGAGSRGEVGQGDGAHQALNDTPVICPGPMAPLPPRDPFAGHTGQSGERRYRLAVTDDRTEGDILDGIIERGAELLVVVLSTADLSTGHAEEHEYHANHGYHDAN